MSIRPCEYSAKRYTRFCGSFAAAALALASCAPPVPVEDTPFSPDLPTVEPELRVLLAEGADVAVSHRGGARFMDAETGDILHTSTTSGSWRLRSAPGGIAATAAGDGAALRGVSVLRIDPVGEAVLHVEERPYRGHLVVRTDGDELGVINHVPMEDYLLGVVPREIGAVEDDLFEAARAQAVAARTYAISRLGRREAAGFDVYATTQDQVYGGMRDEHGPVSRAVEASSGEILTYAGFPIEAYYHSTCAGRTAAIEEVWDAAPRPYLRSVVDVNPATGEAYDHFSSRYRWTERWTGEEIEEVLSRTLSDSLALGPADRVGLIDIEILDRTASGRVRDMQIVTRAGTVHAGGDGVRWILRPEPDRILNSSLFEVSLHRGPGGEIRQVVVDGQGWGHGIGMCQVGAMGRARHGQDYREILTTYYQDTRVQQLYE